MEAKDNLSMEQMKAVLNNVPAAVFVSALKDRRLLYANYLALEMFPEAAKSKAACFHVFGFREPCSFCRIGEMSSSELMVRECRHPGNGHIYQLKGKLIDWAGEEAHIEYILDITEKKQEEEQLKKSEQELTAANKRLQETRLEFDHLINSIPGGIASYLIEDGRFILTYFSDGVPAISGYSREEYEKLNRYDALDFVYELDRPRVLKAIQIALEGGTVLDISYRILHKNGNLIWIHLNGKRMGARTEPIRFYAVFTTMLSEMGTLANETADGIYIINKETYDLLYINEIKQLAVNGTACVGQPCYASLHGLSAPCDFCTLKTFGADEQEHEVEVEGTDLVYTVRVKETIWNGIPAYIQYMRDITEEVHARREKERMEMYFQTLVKNLPGGIAVLRREVSGEMTPEYISEGFAALTDMSVEEAKSLYQNNVFEGVHPDDVEDSRAKVFEFLNSGEEHCEFESRFRKGDGSYVWLKDHVSLLKGADGIQRIYSIYTDISQQVAEREQLAKQYEELIYQHYRTPGPDTVILGHCNITKNRVLEIWEDTNAGLLKTFGRNREEFFKGISTFITDEKERQRFLAVYLNEPSLRAFAGNETERVQKCFMKLPDEPVGRYVQIKMGMVETPDTGDVIGILSVTDVTDQTVSEEILHKLSVTSHDYVIDINLREDSYHVLSCNANASRIPEKPRGSHSGRVAYMAENVVVPKDREVYAGELSRERIEKRLKESSFYTFSYSVEDENGGIRAKTITVSAIDLRLGRVSLVCTDVTGSVREQQSFLNMLAYTFEMMGMIHVTDSSFVLYTRQMILENLSPYISKDYSVTQELFANTYAEESREEAKEQLSLATMLKRLKETPSGYEFVLPCRERERMKSIISR